MLSIIALPSNFVASTTEVSGQLSTDLQQYIILIVGVVLGLVIIEVVIGALRK